MAPLLHQSFDGFSNHYFVQITSHFEWAYGFSRLCVIECVFNWPLCKNVLSRLQKENGPLLYGSLHDFVHMTCKNRTGKWFSSPVDIFMCLQGMIMNKWFFTVGARKWLLSCVDPVMFLQCIIFLTWLVTFCRGK